MAEPRRTLRCPDRIWRGAKHHATHHGDTLSAILRDALCAYLRDRAGFLAAVTPPAVDGPSQPAFSHAELPVQPWRWRRPLGYERPGISQSAASGSAHAAASLVRHDDNTR